MEYTGKVAHGIMFHHFHNMKHPKGPGSISQEDLEIIINFIGHERILSPFEWLERLEENKLGEEHLCLTFDDALLCQFEIALPILEKYNIKAFWFVYSGIFEGQLQKMEVYRLFRANFFRSIDDFYSIFFKKVFHSDFSQRAGEVLGEKTISKKLEDFPFYSVNDVTFRLIRDQVLGKTEYENIMDDIINEHNISITDLSKDLWMSNDNLSYMAGSGHAVGLHSYSHPTVLADLSYKEQFEEYNKNYLHIKRVCGKAPVSMSHPVNSYNEDTIEILKQFGIRCGFRSNMFPKVKGGKINPDRLEMARQDHSNIMKMLKV